VNLRRARHRDDKRRRRSARALTAAKKIAAAFSEMLWAASRRKGFARRYLERLEDEQSILPPGFDAVAAKLPADAWVIKSDQNAAIQPIDAISRNVLTMFPSPYGVIPPGRHGISMGDGEVSIVPLEGAPGYIDIPSDT
jgi:hypothetical protein